MAIFTIPAGYKGLMWAANTAIGKAKDAVGYLFTREVGTITRGGLKVSETCIRTR